MKAPVADLAKGAFGARYRPENTLSER